LPQTNLAGATWDRSDEADQLMWLRSINIDQDSRSWIARLWDRAGEFRAYRPKLSAAALLVPGALILAAGGLAAMQDPDDRTTYALAFTAGGLLVAGAGLCLWRCKA
jgi:hypothetical protein